MKRLASIFVVFALWIQPGGSGDAWSQDNGVLRGEFSQQRTLKGIAKPLLSRGHFVLARDRGLIWTVEAPFKITTVITAAGILQLIDGSKPLQISSARIPFLRNFHKVLSASLSGALTQFPDLFKVKKTTRADGSWQALIKADAVQGAGASPFARFEIEGRHEVQSVLLVRSNGDSDQIRFFNPRRGGAVTGDEAAMLAAAIQ
jgi:hypothetical protein